MVNAIAAVDLALAILLLMAFLRRAQGWRELVARLAGKIAEPSWTGKSWLYGTIFLAILVGFALGRVSPSSQPPRDDDTIRKIAATQAEQGAMLKDAASKLDRIKLDELKSQVNDGFKATQDRVNTAEEKILKALPPPPPAPPVQPPPTSRVIVARVSLSANKRSLAVTLQNNGAVPARVTDANVKFCNLPRAGQQDCHFITTPNATCQNDLICPDDARPSLPSGGTDRRTATVSPDVPTPFGIEIDWSCKATPGCESGHESRICRDGASKAAETSCDRLPQTGASR
jgi:hypothetical protein